MVQSSNRTIGLNRPSINHNHGENEHTAHHPPTKCPSSAKASHGQVVGNARCHRFPCNTRSLRSKSGRGPVGLGQSSGGPPPPPHGCIKPEVTENRRWWKKFLRPPEIGERKKTYFQLTNFRRYSLPPDIRPNGKDTLSDLGGCLASFS